MKHPMTLLAPILLLASCGGDDPEESAAAPAAPAESSAELLSIFEAGAGSSPQSISQLRASVQPGDEVTVSGRVMGNVQPFVEGRAVFLLGDPSVLTSCDERPDDPCETPWDNCCNTPEDKKRGIATIQVVGSDGRVLGEGIEGVRGLGTLDTVTVDGVVAEGSGPDLLVINADAIDVAE